MSSYQKSLLESTETSVDDILERIGWKNVRILTGLSLISLCWVFTAVNMLIESFVDDPECDFSNPSNLTDFCFERQNTSMISELQLYGSRSYLKHSLTSAFMIGSIFGGPLISFCSDKYGRKKAVIWSIFVIGICSCTMLFANDISTILILRFLQGSVYDGIEISGWVLANESIPSILRPIATFVFGFTWVVGYCFVALLAYYIKDWRLYMSASGVPSLVFCFVAFLLVPESLHILVEKGNLEESKKWVRKVAGRTFLKKVDWTAVMKNGEQKDQTNTIWESTKNVLSNPSLLKRVSILAFVWATDMFVYFGMSMFTVSLAGNKYFNFVAVGIVELVAYAICPIMLAKIGRRWTISSTHFLTAILFGIACLFLKKNNPLELIIWLTAKVAISTPFMALFMFAVEVFPTSERNYCIGICILSSKIVGVFSTEIQRTVSIWGPFPLVVFGSLSAMAGFLTLLLPETNNTKLPSSIKNLE